MILVVSGIQIEIERKNVKNMCLYVKPPDGKVMVSAPFSMANDVIERFINTKVNWIKDQINKFRDQTRQAKQKYVTGENLFVWGKPYLLELKYAGRYSLNLSSDKAVLTVRKNCTFEQREKFIRKWYRETLEEAAAKVLPKWEKKTGLKAESWHTKYLTSRWGSCKIKKREICFSSLLAKKPSKCLDYIIVHELCHFIEKGHNARFYNMLEKYIPDWKEIKSVLNSHTNG